MRAPKPPRRDPEPKETRYCFWVEVNEEEIDRLLKREVPLEVVDQLQKRAAWYRGEYS